MRRKGGSSQDHGGGALSSDKEKKLKNQESFFDPASHKRTKEIYEKLRLQRDQLLGHFRHQHVASELLDLLESLSPMVEAAGIEK